MSIGQSIIICFLSLLGVVAEFFLYIFLGFGAALSNNAAQIPVMAMALICLMFLTLSIGLLCPFGAVLEFLLKKEHLANKVVLVGLEISLIISLFVFFKTTSIEIFSSPQPQAQVPQPSKSPIETKDLSPEVAVVQVPDTTSSQTLTNLEIPSTSSQPTTLPEKPSDLTHAPAISSEMQIAELIENHLASNGLVLPKANEILEIYGGPDEKKEYEIALKYLN